MRRFALSSTHAPRPRLLPHIAAPAPNDCAPPRAPSAARGSGMCRSPVVPPRGPSGSRAPFGALGRMRPLFVLPPRGSSPGSPAAELHCCSISDTNDSESEPHDFAGKTPHHVSLHTHRLTLAPGFCGRPTCCGINSYRLPECVRYFCGQIRGVKPLHFRKTAKTLLPCSRWSAAFPGAVSYTGTPFDDLAWLSVSRPFAPRPTRCRVRVAPSLSFRHLLRFAPCRFRLAVEGRRKTCAH